MDRVNLSLQLIQFGEEVVNVGHRRVLANSFLMRRGWVDRLKALSDFHEKHAKISKLVV